MAAHLYWRLEIWSNNTTNDVCSVAELQLRTTAGGGQAATGGTASGNVSSNNPSSAFDGNGATYWYSNTANGHIQYQFPSAVDIVEYAITNRNDSWYLQAPKRFNLMYSDDGANWTIADRCDQQTSWTQGSTKVFTVGANTGQVFVPGSSVGTALRDVRSAFTTARPLGVGSRLLGFRSAGTATIVAGTVKQEGIAVSGKLVRAYDAVCGMPVGQAISAGDGSYSIKCGGFASVFVVAFDPTDYQMVGYDRVTPG